jgi:lathosterol oxidase
MTLGLYFHQLHHRYFEVNYGQLLTPVEKLFGTWVGTADEALAALRNRR